MSNFKYTAGLNNVGSFQVSGVPFASSSINASGSSAVKIEFPYVVNWFIVQNNSDTTDTKVAFSENGLNGSNYFTVWNRNTAAHADRSSIYDPLHLKITEIWMTGSNNMEIIAGLTNIPVERVNNIAPSGSNWSGSVGVG